MKRILRAFATLTLLAAGSCASDGILGVNPSNSFAAGTALHTLSVSEMPRSYVLHVPAKRPTSSTGTLMPYPLIIVLHGSSGSGEDIRAATNMDSVGDANKSIVAYPNGVRGAGGLFPSDWNAGTCCGAAGRENIDDLGFITAMIAQISAKLTVDKRRIYVAGFSDGGRMAHHLACSMSAQFAAIGVVSGSLRDDHCVPAKPVPIIAIHGTDDGSVPYDEAPDTPLTKTVTGVATSLPPSVQFWVGVNGCTTGTNAKFSVDIVRTSFTGCTGGEVMFYSINSGGHTWPVADKTAPTNPDAQISATAVIAQFFVRQLRR